MAAPTIAEAAAYIGTAPADPNVPACLGEAVEAITGWLGDTTIYDAGKPNQATLNRITLEVAKGLYHRRDDHAQTALAASYMADKLTTTRSTVDPLASVMTTLHRIADQKPAVQ